MRKFILPLLLLFVFVLENIFSLYVPTDLFGANTIAVPHFLLIVIIFITVYYHPVRGVYLALLFGFLFDMTYTELFGVYLFAYPLLAYIAANAMKVLQVNIFIVTMLTLLSIIALEYYTYGFLTLLNRANMSGQAFLTERLFQTLMLNGIFLILFSFPLKKFLSRFAAVEEEK